MTTQSSEYKLWRLQSHGGRFKHALFHHSRSFRQDRIYLDDDLTRQQQEGRRALGDRQLQLQRDGHKTWWRRNVLHWTDGAVVHSQRPARS